jgi:hypothetical protein
MRNNRTIRLAAFNIVTHPHTTQGYVNLFHSARKLKRDIPIRGETHGRLGTSIDLDDYSEPLVTGDIYTYLELNINDPWFNTRTGEAADTTQTQEVQIPDYLRPHLKQLRYVFFPKTHLFVFVQHDTGKHRGTLGVNSMSDFLTELLNDPRLLEKTDFKKVEVRSVQDRKSLAWIFSKLKVEQLEITIRRPNGDSSGDAKKSVEEELEEQNLEEYFVKQTAEKGKGIKPNENTGRLLNEAMTNGGVKAKGRDTDDKMQTVNTQSKPLLEPIEISSKKPYAESVIQASFEFAKKAYQRIKIHAENILSDFEDDNT